MEALGVMVSWRSLLHLLSKEGLNPTENILGKLPPSLHSREQLVTKVREAEENTPAWPKETICCSRRGCPKGWEDRRQGVVPELLPVFHSQRKFSTYCQQVIKITGMSSLFLERWGGNKIVTYLAFPQRKRVLGNALFGTFVSISRGGFCGFGTK